MLELSGGTPVFHRNLVSRITGLGLATQARRKPGLVVHLVAEVLCSAGSS